MNTAAQGEAPGEAVVADYLANRLSEAEAQAFELYCLSHPDFAREVERELAFKTGLRHAQSVAPINAAPQNRSSGRWPLALAASVVVLVSAVVVYQFSISSRPGLVAFLSPTELTEQLRHAAVSQLRLVRVRGAESVTHVSVPANGVVEVRLLPDFASESGAYSMQIAAESPASTKPLIVTGLKPSVDGFLQLYLPAAPLVGRTWLISVGEGVSAEVFRVEFTSASAPAH